MQPKEVIRELQSRNSTVSWRASGVQVPMFGESKLVEIAYENF